jgi:hypothetical protein
MNFEPLQNIYTGGHSGRKTPTVGDLGNECFGAQEIDIFFYE